MKLTVNRTDLNIATIRSQGAISEKSMAHIGLKAEEGRLRLSVADRVLAVYSSIKGDIEQSGESFVPARLFSDVVRQLPEGPVVLEQQDNFVVLQAGAAGEFLMKLPRIDDRYWRDPPTINSANTAALPADKLSYMIDQVQFCVAHESPRNYGAVGYVHRVNSSQLRLVGTDGYRLSFSEMDLDLPESFLVHGVCLSKRALNELQRMCGEGFEHLEVCISDDQTTLVAQVPDYQIFVRLSAVKYPNYEGVLPKNDLTPVSISRPHFQSVTKRVLLASDKTRALQLCFSNSSLTLRSRTLGSSESKESIALSDYQGGDRELAINGKFLTDVFSTISSDEVTLNFRSEDDPIVLVPKSEPASCQSMHVLVPIRES
jgi:DNA polymerase-3 subunit beta